jgi:hypothetical protein
MKCPPKAINDHSLRDRVHGSMLGMALGDALGAHVEFCPHSYMVENPVSDLMAGGTWGLLKGQVLASIPSLITRSVFALE